jgi:putative ABC transport system permease protein
MGYALISGRWYAGQAEVVASTRFLNSTGRSVGSSYSLTDGGRSVLVRIVGEVFLPNNDLNLVMDAATLDAVDPSAGVSAYAVGVRPGVNPQSYANTIGARLASVAGADSKSSYGTDFVAVISLVALLTLLLIFVAALGVLNTVVLQLRERVHDLGVFKSVGMTPRQAIAMVVRSVTLTGIVAGVVALPAGVYLHHGVIPVMGHAAGSGIPPSLLTVYPLWQLIALGLAGLVIAVAGALGPAGWAARTRTAFALRAE